MKTPEEILKQHAPGIILFGAGDGSVHKWNAVIKAMEEYAKEYAAQELQRLSKEKEELKRLLKEAAMHVDSHFYAEFKSECEQALNPKE